MNTVDALKDLYKTLCGKDWPYDPNPTDAEVIDKIAADASGSGGTGPLVVSLIRTETGYILDAEWQEIADAYIAGRSVLAYEEEFGQYISVAAISSDATSYDVTLAAPDLDPTSSAFFTLASGDPNQKPGIITGSN